MKSRSELAQGWFRKGDSDLNTARASLQTQGPYDTACFHCQQAVEKYFKGFLDFHGRPYPLIHDLGKLAVLCDGVDASLHLASAEVSALTDYAVALRYDSEFWPTRQVAAEAVKVAEQVRASILAALPGTVHP